MVRFPNALVIILSAIVIAWILSFIIPKGAYERSYDESTDRTTVIADSYRYIDSPHLSPFDLLLSVPKGIVEHGDLVVLILILGGCFYMVEQTGALDQGLKNLTRILRGREYWSLVVLCVLFMIGGFTIALQEELIAMTPILLIFGRSIGYNSTTIIGASYGSAVLGSAFSPFNPFGVLVAQKEAGLLLMSGYEYRLMVLLVAFILWVLYMLKYAHDHRTTQILAEPLPEKITTRNKLILILVGLTFVVVSYGLIQLSWGFNEMSACFFGLGIACGFLAKFGFNKTTDVYVMGFKEMVFAAIIIGLSNSIAVVLKDGMIIDSIVHGLFGSLKDFSPSSSALMMMLSHALLHFSVPSISGHAILTMPILTPVSDLIGLSRQVSILAYQYGGIMMDLIVPTNGATMAVIALGRLKYNEWFKFIIKPTLIMMLVGAIAIVVAVRIGY